MKAFVFPGQGSQSPGMGKDLYENFTSAREVFDEADAALSFPLSNLCFEGPAEQLTLTENTQPAVLTASIAALRVLERRGKRADVVAGHSLGEYSAVVCAGGMSFADAVRVVRERGRFMQQAVPVGQGAMAAVLGLEVEVVARICEESAAAEVVAPANLNAPGQVVIAGHVAAVERASSLAQERGAQRVLRLPVSAPFHCALMKPAQERLAAVLRRVEFRDLRVPLVNNVDAAPVTSAAEVRENLIRQVTSAVRWSESVTELARLGVEAAVEVGPGRVLAGLIRRIDRSIQIRSIGTLAQVEKYV
jgi:[acyl-carrier-protein] S-malonyltransferase